MGNITGKIEKLESNKGTSRAGLPYERWVFTIDNKKYSTFDEQIGKKFKIGDNVVMTGQQAGKFWNMESMDLTDEPQEAEDEKTITESEKVRKELSTTDKLLTQILEELKNGNK